MSKKKKEPEMPQAQSADPKPRSSDRHKPRRTISFDPAIVDQLSILADQNNRPLAWEARKVLIEHLQKHGLWPPPGGSSEPDEEDSE